MNGLRRLVFPLTSCRGWIVVTIVVAAGACPVYREIEVEPIQSDVSGPLVVESSVKAHLLDGSTVVYPEGVTVEGGSILGGGTRYDAVLKPMGTDSVVPLDSVAAMESYPGNLDALRTTVYSVAGGLGATVGGIALFKALFGSCPTIYADSSGTRVLQAEAFPYSIAPLLEGRDVDRLYVSPNAHGRLTLDVRNEALETHYINQMALLEVYHARGERVVPDERGIPLALNGFYAPFRVVDRVGRDVSSTLAAADGEVYSTAPAVVRSATTENLEDWVLVEAPAPAGVDSVALVFRMRNSLLQTVLLYDLVLDGQGIRALDWVGRDLARLGNAVELGMWAHKRMGLRISVWRNGRWETIRRVADSGPIAWSSVAAVIPTGGSEVLRVRLSFPTDGWRIDRLELAANVRRPSIRHIPPDSVTTTEGKADRAALEAISRPDGDYLRTVPGERIFVHYDVGKESVNMDRAFLLLSQGYYIEWIRGTWIRSRGSGEVLTPGDKALLAALQHWTRMGREFEKRFYSTRVPIP